MSSKNTDGPSSPPQTNRVPDSITPRPHLLLVANSIHTGDGGGSTVAAWALQALQDRYQVTVLTWVPPDVAAINRGFGTSIRAEAFQWVTAGGLLRFLIAAGPFRLALLSTTLLARSAEKQRKLHKIDLVVGLNNEMALGVPILQYVHYPVAMYPILGDGVRWFHFDLLVRAYRFATLRFAVHDDSIIQRNTTLVNSAWTGRIFTDCYKAPAAILYPPVPGGFPIVPFADRQNRFVTIGRFSPEKDFEKLIDVIQGVRSRGHEIGLDIVGPRYNERYARQIERRALELPWVTLYFDLPRDRLVELVAHRRFGLHGMVGEHFGIAPAELQRAGCVTFVAAGGGQEEIVDHDRRVIYNSVADAVAKVDRVLGDPVYHAGLAHDVQARAARHSEQRFMDEFRTAIDRCLATGATADSS